MSISTLTTSTNSNSIFTGSPGVISINGSGGSGGSGLITSGNLGNYYNGTTSIDYHSFSFDPYNSLKSLSYSVDFQFNGKEFTKKILTDKIKGIKKNKFIFFCNYVNNRIQPYELIMKLIEKKEKISVKVKVLNNFI
jgi:hypothetical protein